MSNVKTKIITMKVSEKEKKKINRDAKKYADGNVSELIRNALISYGQNRSENGSSANG